MSTETQKPTLYTLRQVAELVGLSFSTVRRAADAGALPVTRLAKRVVRVTPEQLQDWISNSSTQPTQTTASKGA